ncbi:MAG: 4Fe-4S dicluster domain-containing protein [Planctomycetaceae bacterium]|nr:4Fe-4S dicluster domain-containing protein [Planctomycetaceae bacterium]
MAKGVLVNLTKCIGCGSCTVACKMYNGNQWINDRAATDGERAELADENWTVIQKFRVPRTPNTENAGNSENATKKSDESNGTDQEIWRFVKRQCMHCKEPGCVSSCFAKAFQKTEAGPVVYYPDNCVGCRYCMLACPFKVPKFEWNKTIPVITKCVMCGNRVANGLPPACVSVCPTNVMKFGDYDELLAEAKEMIRQDARFVQHIYGEEEAGGTSWIYISDTPFEQLGFKMNVPKKPIPSYTSSYMHSTPVVGAVWGLILTGLYFFTKRKEQVKAAEKNDSIETENS